MPTGPENLPDFIRCGFRIDGLNGSTGGHDFTHHRVGKAYDIADEFPIFLLQDAFGLPFLQERRHRVITGFFINGFAFPVLGFPLPFHVPSQGRQERRQGPVCGRVEGKEPNDPVGRSGTGEQGWERQIHGPDVD